MISYILEKQIKSVHEIPDCINVEWLLLLHHWPTLVPICKPDRLEEHSKLEENHRLFVRLSNTFSNEIESRKDYAYDPIKLTAANGCHKVKQYLSFQNWIESKSCSGPWISFYIFSPAHLCKPSIASYVPRDPVTRSQFKFEISK